MYLSKDQINDPTARQLAIAQGSSIRADAYTLRQKYDLGKWAECLLAHVTGKGVFVHPDDDRRSTKVNPTLVQGLKAIARMFQVDDMNQFSYNRKAFDEAGFRYTTWAEIARIGMGRTRREAFSRKQVRVILSILTKGGIIDRVREYNASTETSRLAIRFQAGRIMAIIDSLELASKNGSVPECVQFPTVKYVREDIKNRQNKQASETVSRALEGPSILYIKKPLPMSPAVPASNDEVVSQGCAAREKNPVLRPGVEFSVFLKTFGDVRLRTLIGFIRHEFSAEIMTVSQAKRIRRLTLSNQLSRKMTAGLVADYFSFRANSPPTWLSVCNLDTFITAWPTIVKLMHQDRLFARHPFSVDHFKIDHNRKFLTDKNLYHVLQVVSRYYDFECRMNILPPMATSGWHMAGAILYGRPDLAEEVLLGSREKVLAALMDTPTYAINLLELFPKLRDMIQITAHFWQQLQKADAKDFQYLCDLGHMSDAWGIEQLPVAVAHA